MYKSKRYRKNQEMVPKEKSYTIPEAVGAVKKLANAKFDESVDIAFRLGVDPKYSDQMVRGNVVLPHGTGKTKKVVVLTKNSDKEAEAKKAQADYVGADDLIEKIKGGWFDFDVLVVTPEIMRDLSKLGKVLGPKGLMPSPKAGTVTNDIGQAVDEIKKGKVEFKVDKTGNVHIAIGKASFEEQKLQDNIEVAIKAVVSARPAAAKGQYIKTCSLSSTMGPGLRLDLKDAVSV